MGTEELMRPRFKVIADYPQGHFLDSKGENPVQVGDIFMQLVSNPVVWRQLTKQRNDFTDITVHNPEWYPAIFKRLEWWQERKEKEMPKYLKAIYNTKDNDGENIVIYKVYKWEMEYPRACIEKNLSSVITLYPGVSFSEYPILPAAEAQYQEYIKNK